MVGGRLPLKTVLSHWLLLSVLLGVLGGGVWYLLKNQHSRLENAFRNQAEQDMQLLYALVHEALRTQDYQAIGHLFGEWGRNRQDTVSIHLSAENGFVIGRYEGERQATNPLRLTREIPYSYRKRALLALVLDRSDIHRGTQRLHIELGVMSALVASVFVLLVVAVLRGKRLNQGMREQARALSRTSESLERISADHERLNVFLKGLVDSMPSVLFGVDAQGRVNQWNLAAEKSTRVKADDAMGQYFNDLMPHLSNQYERVVAAIEENVPMRASRLTMVTGGTVRYSDLLVHPVSGGTCRGAVIRVDDVTQRVRFEQMMVQNEKMLSLGGLAAGVAHEINSPLSGVLQNCQNISRRLSSDLAINRRVAEAAGVDLDRMQDYLDRRKIPEFVRMVREAAERASHIVTDMLAFSRRGTEGFEKVALADLLDSAVRLASSDYDMKKTHGFRRIEIKRELEPELPLLHCDRTRLEQVLLNLLKNSAQAMTLANTPSPRTIRLRARVDGEWLLIQVEDNGPGMSEQVKQRIFEPFYTTREAGTGLGLSVAYLILTEQHKGRIDVSSEVGGGTRFDIRLPLKKPDAIGSGGFTPAS